MDIFHLFISYSLRKSIYFKLREFDCSVKMHDTQFSFLTKRNNGTVDVWWLFDDGGIFILNELNMCDSQIFIIKLNFTGLALIIAHIFKSCDVWKKCNFRIFGVTDQLINVDKEKNK